MTRRDLKKLAGKTGAERRAALAEIRRRAVRLVRKKGRKPGQVAKLFDITPQTMSTWLAQFDRGGDGALQARKATGRPPALTAKELARLRRTIIGKNPDQLNFGTLLWTLPIVRELIKRMFGKELYSGTVGRYLNRLGLTPQKPIRRAYQRDEAEIRRWVTHEFPRISSDVQRKQAVLLFLDETGVHENAPVGTTWGKRGTRPIVRVTGNRSKINVISAVAPSGRLWFRCYRGNLNTDRFTEFLAALLHDVRGDIVLVMDSHPAHVSAKARTFMETRSNRLQVEFLPLYAPEINPDEHVWAVLKSLFRRNPLSQGERLDSAVESAMREIRRRPSFVRALFGHPDLAYLDGKVA